MLRLRLVALVLAGAALGSVACTWSAPSATVAGPSRFDNGRVEWVTGSDTAELALSLSHGQEVRQSGIVTGRRLRGHTAYDYQRQGQWATITRGGTGVVLLTLPDERLSDDIGATSWGPLPDSMQQHYEYLRAAEDFELIADITAPKAPSSPWCLFDCRQRVYRSKQPAAAAEVPPAGSGGSAKPAPPARRDPRLRIWPVPRATKLDEPRAFECAYWLSEDGTALAERETFSDMTSRFGGFTRFVPGATTLSPPTYWPEPPWGIVLVVLTNPDLAFAEAPGQRDPLDWNWGYECHEYDPGKLLRKTGGAGPLGHMLDLGMIPSPDREPTLAADSARIIGLSKVYLPRALPEKWWLVQATVSGARDPMQHDYLWEGTTRFACVSFGLERDFNTSLLLLQRPAKQDDRREWATRRDIVEVHGVKVHLVTRRGVVGDNFVALVGHNVSDADLLFLQNQLAPYDLK